MSIQKQNYDQLVNQDGTYGINIAENIFPGSPDNPGVKGNKGTAGVAGDKGAKGQKGKIGVGVQGLKGTKGQKGRQSLDGQKGIKGNKGHTGNEGPKGNKGLTGQGDKGQKGQQAAAPLFVFKGDVNTIADLPTVPTPQVGDTYLVLENDNLYAWNGTAYDSIAETIGVVKGQKGAKGIPGVHGDNGTKGQKGQTGLPGSAASKGDKGQKGQTSAKGEKGTSEKGDKGQKGITGPAADKGQKGQKGVDVDADDYYTKGQVDSLISDFRPPQESFDPYQYPSPNRNVINSGTVDFNSVDNSDAIFDPGVIMLGSAVTVQNAPFEAFSYLIVNYVGFNSQNSPATDNRPAGYSVVQCVYNNSVANGTTVQGAFRFYKPANGSTSLWHQTTFDPNAYVTTADFNAATDIALTQTTNAAENVEDINLTQDGTVDSTVSIKTQGGLLCFAGADDTIVIDGSALQGQTSFQGPITAGTDPATLDPDASGGQYFIYTDSGTAWNGDAVQAGDWAIYRASDTTWINLNYAGVDPGVTSLTVEGGILTETGTAASPVIGLTTQNLLQAGIIESIQLGNVLRNFQIADLADVQLNFTSIYSPAKYTQQTADNEPPGPLNGDYSVVPGENAIWFNSADALAPANLRINALAGASTIGSKWAIYASNGEWSASLTYVSSVQGSGNIKVIFKEATAVALVQGATTGSGAWEVKLVESNGLLDNQALIYNAANRRWLPETVATESEISASYAALAPATSDQNTFTNAQRWKYATASGSNSGWTIEGRTSDNGSTTQSLVSVTRGSNSGRDKFIYNAPSGGSFVLNEVVNGSILNAKLAGYIPNTGDAIVQGNIECVSTNSANGRVSATDTSSKGVILFPQGTINVNGASNSLNLTGSAVGTMNIGTQIAWSTLIISTTNASGGSLSSNGTVKIGRENGNVNIFQVFDAALNGSSANPRQMFAVKTDGYVTCLQAKNKSITQLPDEGLPTKQQVEQLSSVASPAGMVAHFVAPTAPDGWYLANGTVTFDIATHPKLHAALQLLEGYVSGTVPSLSAPAGLHAIIRNDSIA